MDRSTWLKLKKDFQQRTGANSIKVSGNKLIFELPKIRVAVWPIKAVKDSTPEEITEKAWVMLRRRAP